MVDRENYDESGLYKGSAEMTAPSDVARATGISKDVVTAVIKPAQMLRYSYGRTVTRDTMYKRNLMKELGLQMLLTKDPDKVASAFLKNHQDVFTGDELKIISTIEANAKRALGIEVTQ